MALLNVLECLCAWMINHGDQGGFSPTPPLLLLTPCSLQLGTDDVLLMRTTLLSDRRSKLPVSKSICIKI